MFPRIRAIPEFPVRKPLEGSGKATTVSFYHFYLIK